jgi:hypothetical protein
VGDVDSCVEGDWGVDFWRSVVFVLGQRLLDGISSGLYRKGLYKDDKMMRTLVLRD